jgi:hypothetical protein
MLRGALQMLGIAHVDQLVGFWSSEVNPKIGTPRFDAPPRR